MAMLHPFQWSTRSFGLFSLSVSGFRLLTLVSWRQTRFISPVLLTNCQNFFFLNFSESCQKSRGRCTFVFSYFKASAWSNMLLQKFKGKIKIQVYSVLVTADKELTRVAKYSKACSSIFLSRTTTQCGFTPSTAIVFGWSFGISSDQSPLLASPSQAQGPNVKAFKQVSPKPGIKTVRI